MAQNNFNNGPGGRLKKEEAKNLINFSFLNPKNWGVKDYSEYETRGKAYNAARKAGEKEFMWNGSRFNTNMEGTPAQQLKWSGITNEQLQNRNIIQERLSNNLNPRQYKDPVERLFETVALNKKEISRIEKAKVKEDLSRMDAFNLYTGKPQVDKTFGISDYKPSKSKDKNSYYYKILDKNSPSFGPTFENLFSLKEANYSNLPFSEKILTRLDKNGNLIPYGSQLLEPYQKYDQDIMGNFKVNTGEDEKGKYISYYDKWDVNPFSLKNPITNKEITTDFGKPFEIYDRIYYKDYGDGRQKRMYYSDKELSNLDVNKKDFDTLALQKELSNRGYELPTSTKEDGNFDGIFGPETKAALEDYQKKTQGSRPTIVAPVKRP